MRLGDIFDFDADHARLISVILLGTIIVAIYQFTQPVDLLRHTQILQNLSELQRDEARLGESVLQLNFQLTNNYDEVTRIMEHMNQNVSELREAKVATNLKDDEAFQHELKVLENRLINKQQALEQFKSQNAILKNSLIYIPHAVSEIEKYLPTGAALHEALDEVIVQVLVNRVHGKTIMGQELQNNLAIIKQKKALLPGKVRLQIDKLVRHIDLINQIEQAQPLLIEQLTSTEGISAIEISYQRYYKQQQVKSSEFRFFLLIATLGLLAYTAHTLNRLRENAKNLRLAASVFDNASEGLMICNSHADILDVNPSFIKMTGYTRDEVIGRNPRLLNSGQHSKDFYELMWKEISNKGHWEGEIWNKRKNGEIFPEWLSVNAITGPNGSVTQYIGTFTDISEHKRSEEKIHNLAFYDSLTGLPNRRLLIDRLRQSLLSSSRQQLLGAILFIDLDDFKLVNDTRGHHVGDLLLIEVAKRIQSCLHTDDTVARLGSDEFVVVLDSLSKETEIAAQQAESVADRIHKSIRQPLDLNGSEYFCECCIGISFYRDHETTLEDLLKHADSAMFQAKQTGRNKIHFFDERMQTILEERVLLESWLRKAIPEQLRLFYQLQVDNHGKALGAEALVRWIHPERGLISPAEFIPLAEETGLIHVIGDWVLETACNQLKAWESQAATRDLMLAVNVSAKQFHKPEFIPQVLELLNKTGADPSRLKLELTESLFAENFESIISKMNTLKSIGVSFSLDDFGTGFSSLSYLKRLPLDQLKIDQSFVRDLTTDANDAAIVRTIIALGQSLSLAVIAEGVETEGQRNFLAIHGCNQYQGYLFSKPVQLSDFEQLVLK